MLGGGGGRDLLDQSTGSAGCSDSFTPLNVINIDGITTWRPCRWLSILLMALKPETVIKDVNCVFVFPL